MAFTLQDRDPIVSYEVGASAQSVFTIPFEFFDVNDITLIIDDGTDITTYEDLNGFKVTPVSGSVLIGSSVGYDSGTLTLDTAVTDSTVIILRKMVIDRQNQHPTSGVFDVNALNKSLSRIFAILQEQRRYLDRSLRLQDSDLTESILLPAVADRAEKFLYFDSEGNASASASLIDATTIVVGSAMETFLASSTLAAARTELAVPGLADNNTFTGTNAFTGSTFNVESTSGTTANFRNTDAANVANQVQINYGLKDSTEALTSFGRMYINSVVITDGNESGEFVLSVMEGGSQTTYITMDGVNSRVEFNRDILFNAPGTAGQLLTSAGAGAVATFSDQTGVRQMQRSIVVAATTANANIPLDNTLPQSGEGVEVTTVSITPKNASSLLVIEYFVTFGAPASTAGDTAIIALFKDSDADAIAAEAQEIKAASSISQIVGRYVVSAASTTARTYKLRFGSDAAATRNLYVNNDDSNSSILSTAGPRSGIIVTEILNPS